MNNPAFVRLVMSLRAQHDQLAADARQWISTGHPDRVLAFLDRLAEPADLATFGLMNQPERELLFGLAKLGASGAYLDAVAAESDPV